MDSVQDPPLNEADLLFIKEMTIPHGPLRLGKVLIVSRELGIGYVAEEASGFRYMMSKRLIPDVFEDLQEGTDVQFRLNNHLTIVELFIVLEK